MLVRMLVGIAGPHYTLAPGDEFHFPNDEAERLVVAGFAVPVAETKIERAVVTPVVETRTAATTPGTRGKRKGKPNVVSGDNNGGGD